MSNAGKDSNTKNSIAAFLKTSGEAEMAMLQGRILETGQSNFRI